MILWQSSKVSSEWIDKRVAFDFVMRLGSANKQVYLRCSRLLRIFDFVINTVHASAVQINKFICVALGFCVFLRIKQ